MLTDIEFWQLLRQEFLQLRPGQYDITSICNLTCEGCLFFSGDDYLGHKDTKDLISIEAFFAGEGARGVRYSYFGGAEPSLAEKKLVIAGKHIPYGVVFTNGIKRLSGEIDYRVHILLWGNPERSRQLRGADIMTKQIKNYRGDRRAVFVFTLTARNLDDIPYIADVCADNGLALTYDNDFNNFQLGGQQRLIKLWRLWCELFLNDDRLRMPFSSSDNLNIPLTSIAEHSRVSHQFV